MAINLDELVIERMKSLTFTDLADGSVIGRLTKLEDVSLNTTSESEDVTDAIGSVITKIFKAKTGRIEGSNSLFSANLLAQQYGTTKEVASGTSKIIVPCEQILTIEGGQIELAHTPHGQIKYIYRLVNGGLADKYTLGAGVSATEFTITDKVIETPTDVTGSIYVEYEYESEEAIRVVNRAEDFPTSVGVKMYGIFRDVCNDNIKYYGAIVAKKGKFDASSTNLSLTPNGKHPFAIDFMKDYCADDGESELFSVVIAK